MKYALIIGNNKYDDQKLAQLKTPAADSQALAKILDDKTIGSFDEVTPLINQTEGRVRRAISSFLTNKKPDDLVLLYFSGHGVLDDRGRLYLALKDTQFDLLKATSIPSSFVADEMDSCRSKRQILILDCCHSGAFARGTKGEQKAITETTFEGSGFGRVVLTASDSTQYALEGDQVIKQSELSLFTHFLLEGLKTGEADVNNDGLIALDEWYDYTYGRVISETPKQVPHKWSYNQQGDLIIAKNPYLKKKVVELPYELVQALESSFFGIRESAVNELGKYLHSNDLEMVELAIASLRKMKEDDSRRISSLAERLLAEFEKARTPGIKVIPKPIADSEPATASVTSNSSMPVPNMTAQIESAARASQPKVGKSIGTSLASPKLLFNPSFWFKWIGISVLGLIFLSIIFDYDGTIISSGSYPFPGSYIVVILFGVVAGALGFIQWFLFRNRLQDWWIVANAATAIVLGLFHRSLYYAGIGWEHEYLRIPLVVWLIGNFALGPILMRRTQEGSKDFSSPLPTKPAAELVETGTRQKSEEFVFDLLFWFKWIGATFLGAAILNLVGTYPYDKGLIPSVSLLFCIVASLVSLIQVTFFPDALGRSWIAANGAAGIFLGWLTIFLYEQIDWWGKDQIFAFWVIGNLILGPILMRKIREKSKDVSPASFSPKLTIEFMETGARQNLFTRILSIDLVLAGLLTPLVVIHDKGLLNVPSAILNTCFLFYGIAGVFVGISFISKKEVPRNFGFITLAVFAFLDGINAGIYAFFSYYPINLLPLLGAISLVSSIFFISQREIWENKNIGFIMLSGYLIFLSLAYSDIMVYPALIISAIFALLAAVFFFLRK